VIEGDALDVDLPDFTACVANLPYGVSSEIAFRLLPEGKPLVLMFQAEFAERMVASAGESEYGRLSVRRPALRRRGNRRTRSEGGVRPQPAVESAVVRCLPAIPTTRWATRRSSSGS